MHESKVVKTRKDHTCEGCCADIPKGSNVGYHKGMFDGGFYSYYLCDECTDFIKNLDAEALRSLAEEGFHRGDIGEWRREAERESVATCKSKQTD